MIKSNKLLIIPGLEEMMEKSVDFIFISYNTKDKIKESLESLRRNIQNIPYNVYVVDNHSTDGSVEYLRRLDWITLIEHQENLGVSKACNTGIRAGNGHYVVILPGDLVFTPNWLPPMLEMLEADPKIAVIGNRQVSKLNTLFTAGRTGTNRANQIGRDDGCTEENDPDRYNIPVECVIVAGACTLFKRDIFDIIGLFDENYFFGGEDNDICYQARYLGYKSVYCPNSVVIHDHGSSLATLREGTRKQLIVSGMDYFVNKWAHFMDDPREFRRDLPLEGYSIPTGIIDGKILLASLIDKDTSVTDEFLKSLEQINYAADLQYCFVTNIRDAEGFMPCREFGVQKILEGKHIVATKLYDFPSNAVSKREDICNLLDLAKIFGEKLKAGCYEYLLYIQPNTYIDPDLVNRLLECKQDVVIFETSENGGFGYFARASIFNDRKWQEGIWEYFEFYQEIIGMGLKIFMLSLDGKLELFTAYDDIFLDVKELKRVAQDLENVLADLKVRGNFQYQKLCRVETTIRDLQEHAIPSGDDKIKETENKINEYIAQINEIEEQLIPIKERYASLRDSLANIGIQVVSCLPRVIDNLNVRCQEVENIYTNIGEKFDWLNTILSS